MFRKFLIFSVLSVASMCAPAQTFPDKPILLIVPFAPGASADGIARIVGRELSTRLGQQVIVENRPGAGGATGLIAAAKSAPNGYTISMGATGAIVVNPHLPDAPPLEPQKQLLPLAKIADIPLVLIARSNSEFLTLKNVIDKAKSTDLPTGHTGVYSAQHLSTELLAAMTKSKLPPVAYKGSAPAVTDVLGGQTPLAMVDLTSAAAHMKAGTIRALAVTSPARTRLAPDVPTMVEAGVPGYSATAWMGVFGPAGLPPPVLERFTKELRAIAAATEVQSQILSLSAEPAFLDSAQFTTFIAGESEKWGKIVASIPKPTK